MIRHCAVGVGCLMLLLATAPRVNAVQLSINNPSFESDVPPDESNPANYDLTAGQFSGLAGAGFGAKVSSNPAPGWTATGGGSPYVGEQNVPIGVNGMTQSPPDGTNIAYMDGGNSLSQILGDNLQPNTQYTLSVYLGLRGDGNNTPQWRVELFAGASSLNSGEYAANTVPAGEYELVSITYTSPGIVAGGQALRIALSNVGNPTAQFDMVTLDAIAVPEPSSIGLIGVGAVGWLASVRRRRMAR